jgi:hypothetical protein
MYTQTIRRTTQLTAYGTTQLTTDWKECGPSPVFARYILAFALQLMKKHGKISVRIINCIKLSNSNIRAAVLE